MSIAGFDHVVLTVVDPDETVRFYEALGMTEEIYDGGRRALTFGHCKLNLHRAGNEIAPHASYPLAGSADMCLLTTTHPTETLSRLRSLGIAIEIGPVPRRGARGMMTSVYVRDPDGNLVELASYDDAVDLGASGCRSVDGESMRQSGAASGRSPGSIPSTCASTCLPAFEVR